MKYIPSSILRTWNVLDTHLRSVKRNIWRSKHPCYGWGMEIPMVCNIQTYKGLYTRVANHQFGGYNPHLNMKSPIK